MFKVDIIDFLAILHFLYPETEITDPELKNRIEKRLEQYKEKQPHIKIEPKANKVVIQID